MSDEPLIAVFVDFENLALGVRDTKWGQFRVDLVLKRMLEKGRIVYKRAYCDWSNYRDDVREFHGHGIELVDIPRSKMSGKNSADIHMVVDALDLCYSKTHIDVFALLTGDSDFSPLVSKLKENDKRVIGCGVKQSTSNLLIANCDEFIYYDDLMRASQKVKPKRSAGRRPAETADKEKAKEKDKPAKDANGREKAGKSERRAKGGSEPSADAESERNPEAMDQLVEIIESLSQDYDQVWGSMIKQAIKRVYPGFNEGYMGYRGFGDLLKHAESEGYIDLDFDESRGNYKVHLLD
jgi:uncharacterized LabA/DUF88 family protein